jgi:[acyl-carrier-protein] S-malonyltransferase
VSFACVFPGQGSQSVGMLAALAADEAVVRDAFAEANDALGYDLWAICKDGPAEALNDTRRTQPALLAAGVAVWRAWRAHGGDTPALMAGHSLGEYTALVCAGALDFGAALKLVEHRGELMQQAVPAGTGAMAAVIGLDDEGVRAACAEAAQGDVVEAVNYNSPGQVVIAGHAAAVERAGAAAKARGAKRVLPLPVSVPSHCALMKPAAEALATRLADTAFNAPATPVVLNVTAGPATDAAAIRDALARQLYSPVRWVESMCYAADAGVTMLVECGPGKVLGGLAKRIDERLSGVSINDPDSLKAALAAVKDSQ